MGKLYPQCVKTGSNERAPLKIKTEIKHTMVVNGCKYLKWKYISEDNFSDILQSARTAKSNEPIQNMMSLKLDQNFVVKI